MSKFFQHPQALVESNNIGKGTRIWAFAHVLPGAQIGKNCNICDHVFIENDVIVGNRVTIKCGVYLWDGIRLADDVFVGPNATFTNDNFPRSKQYLDEFSQTFVDKGASIGANATILPGIRIGRCAMVGAGAVVTRHVPPFAIVVENPAKIVGYVETKKQSFEPDSAKQGTIESNVGGVFLQQIKHVRGDLISGLLLERSRRAELIIADDVGFCGGSREGEVQSTYTGEDVGPERQSCPSRGNSYPLVFIW